MAFISLMFAGAILIMLMIGLIFLLSGLVIDIVWIVRAKKGKKTSLLAKIFGILLSIAGFAMFVLPVSFALVSNAVHQTAAKNRFDSIEKKVYVKDDSSWQEGFEFDGKNLICIDFLYSSNDDEWETVGALVYYGQQYYDICSVENEGNYNIYGLKKTRFMYCDEAQKEAIRDYYYNKAELNATISYYEDGDKHEYACDFDKNILFEIRDYYDTRSQDYSGPIENVDRDYRISVESKDGLFYESISLSEIGEDIVLNSVSGGGNMQGIILDKDKADYVRSQVDKWMH